MCPLVIIFAFLILKLTIFWPYFFKPTKTCVRYSIFVFISKLLEYFKDVPFNNIPCIVRRLGPFILFSYNQANYLPAIPVFNKRPNS